MKNFSLVLQSVASVLEAFTYKAYLEFIIFCLQEKTLTILKS